MVAFQDAFISYGRTDSKTFAIRLKDRLTAAGLTVWFDFDDIPLATDFQERIDNGIEKAHAFLYVISPSSVNSTYCDKELNLALRCGKRIIPIMHVESIDRDAWQQRVPDGTEDDWQTFQAEKKHNTDNLNKTVGKLNWVFFQEGDDFEQSLQGLLALFPLHQDYVQRHTQLLLQALTWERNHRQTRYLLVGNDRIEAEQWLNVHFADEAAPCEPTPLHCEFITEATKNANNLMTQVFLCHDDQDQNTAEQIRQSLMRRGITVWNYRTDIQTSQDYHGAIARGVEEADNVIFILSPHAAQSNYCQRELAMALQLHKRVIPILAAPTDEGMVPESLKSLQYVDLTDNRQASDYWADESELLKQLNTEAAYYTEHKTWLTQALKWERQQQNPTMLLRGYNLRRAESWLKVARTHGQPPTELQEQFIAESLRQPSDGALDVFVSYSRVDADFARRLNEALQVQGKRTWFDQESIATGADFQQEIYRGIENSDVFLFVLSPQSVASPYCADEVEYAESLNKRMVTVLHRPVDTENVHPVLAKLQWLDFRDHDGDFQVNFQELLRTLDTDREHLETHTRLLGRALEWDRGGRDESLLLRGQNLESAEGWLVSNGKVEPRPTGLQQEYVRAGRALQTAKDAADRKLRRGVRLGVVAATLGVLMAVVSGVYARQQVKEAELAQIGTRLEQAGVAAINRMEFDQVGALLKAIKAGRELQTEVEKAGFRKVSDYPAASPILALQRLQVVTVSNRLLGHEGGVNHASFNANGTQVMTHVDDGTARVWDLNSGDFTPLEGHEGQILHASFNANGTQVVTASADDTARVWDLNSGDFTPLKGHEGGVNHASFNADGTQVVTASADDTARVWDLNSGDFTPLEGHEAAVLHASFNADGTQVVTASADDTARVWDLNSGESIPLKGHEAAVLHASFNADGTQVVTSDEVTARVWDLNSGESIPLERHNDFVNHASFNADGTQVVTNSYGGTAHVWDLNSGESIPLVGHKDFVSHASFNADGTQVVTASSDGTARVWDLNSGESIPLKGHESGVNHASFNADGTQVVTASWDGTARVWDLNSDESIPLGRGNHASFNADGTRVATTGVTARVWDLNSGESIPLAGHEDLVTHASFNADGTQVVTASYGGTARVWDLSNGESIPLETHEGDVTHASFNADGTQVVTASDNGTARVWDLNSGESIPLKGHEGRVNHASFNADGTQVVTASADGTVHVWDLNSGESIPLKGHEHAVSHASFNADGTQVVTTSYGGTVRVWDLNNGESIPLERHEGGVSHASFNADGTQVVTASDDATARVWDPSNGESIPLEGHEGGVSHASFNADGTQVVTTSGDGTTRMWDLKGRQLAIFEGNFGTLNSDGRRVTILQDDRVNTHDILTLPELLDWSCQWLDTYLKYGKATDADRALCNLPPRDNTPQPDTVSSADTSATFAVSPFVSDMVHSAIVDPSFFTSAPQTDA
ncbi:MAG: TIR domain-containing protein [Leptolyngbya sp. SIO3F4]|nr:TIR domain-containing protein [Leptolyngbya sp. SIO3F4]